MTIHTLDRVDAPHTDALTERVRATWSDGDFGRIATGYERGGAEFVARLGLFPDERVLDVACGTGNVTLPAARTGARVSGLDIAANLLEQLQLRATAEGLRIDYREGNCEALPYEDASFDTVISMFGAMFAARPERAAAELLRVCRPGGRIAMANWTPGGFIGQMLKTTVAYVPPPAGLPSPLLWGDEATIGQRLGDTSRLRLARRLMAFEYPFPPFVVVDLFRAWYGPTKRAFDALEPEGRRSLHDDLIALWTLHNRATDGTTRVESEFLEVLAIRA